MERVCRSITVLGYVFLGCLFALLLKDRYSMKLLTDPNTVPNTDPNTEPSGRVIYLDLVKRRIYGSFLFCNDVLE